MTTVITQEQDVMLRYWRGMIPDISPQELANNLIRRFNISKNEAWIIVAWSRNEQHTREKQAIADDTEAR